MSPGEFEQIAAETYDRAGLSMDRAVTPLFLARELLDSILEVERQKPIVILNRNTLKLKTGTDPSLRAWRVARALGFWVLRQRGAVDEDDIDMMATCLRTPRPAFTRVVATIGPDFQKLAAIFGISETSAALRYGETTGTQVIVSSGELTRFRGVRRPNTRPTLVRLSAPGRSVRIFSA